MFNKWKTDKEIATQCRKKLNKSKEIGNKGQRIAVERKI